MAGIHWRCDLLNNSWRSQAANRHLAPFWRRAVLTESSLHAKAEALAAQSCSTIYFLCYTPIIGTKQLILVPFGLKEFKEEKTNLALNLGMNLFHSDE